MGCFILIKIAFINLLFLSFIFADWENSLLPQIATDRKQFFHQHNQLETRLLTFKNDKKIKEEKATLYFLNEDIMAMNFHLFGRKNKVNSFLVRGKRGWFYNPGLQFPLHVSLSTRVSGQVNLNDFLNIDYQKNYEIKKVKGTLKNWTLILLAKRKGLSYPRIELRGEKYLLLDAIYSDRRKKPIKRIEYQRKTVGGLVVEEYVFYDLLFDNNKRYEYRIDKLKKHSFSEIYFSPNYLSRLHALTEF